MNEETELKELFEKCKKYSDRFSFYPENFDLRRFELGNVNKDKPEKLHLTITKQEKEIIGAEQGIKKLSYFHEKLKQQYCEQVEIRAKESYLLQEILKKQTTFVKEVENYENLFNHGFLIGAKRFLFPLKYNENGLKSLINEIYSLYHGDQVEFSAINYEPKQGRDWDLLLIESIVSLACGGIGAVSPPIGEVSSLIVGSITASTLFFALILTNGAAISDINKKQYRYMLSTAKQVDDDISRLYFSEKK